MRDCLIIVARGREGNQVSPSVPGDDAPKKTRFYALQARGSKLIRTIMMLSSCFSLFNIMSSF